MTTPDPGGAESACVVIGVIAAPGAPAELAGQVVHELEHDLRAQSPEVQWRLEVRVDALVQPPAEDAEIVAAARQVLLGADWDLAVVLTDLPLRVGRRAVVAHASPVQGVGVLSVPALGAVATRRRCRATLIRLLDTLVGTPNGGGDRTQQRARRTRQLAGDDGADEGSMRLTTRLLTGNISLIAGMVWANQPWQLASGLSRALVASLTAGVFALVTPDIWVLADNYGPWRLTGVMVASVCAIAATLILGAELWERSEPRQARRQVVLFNIATTATVLIGVVSLYAVLLVLALLAALAMVVPELHAQSVGHAVDFGDALELAWLTSSLATVGGALGAGLETDESVRRAAYTYRTDAVPDGLEADEA